VRVCVCVFVELAFGRVYVHMQITMWGPEGNINDYASKQWNGLIGSYYLVRWQVKRELMRTSVCPCHADWASARVGGLPVPLCLLVVPMQLLYPCIMRYMLPDVR